MPTHSEITALRKNGDLAGAKAAAMEALQTSPRDRYIQGAYGWVLYEELKRDVDAFHKEDIRIGRLIHTLDHVAEEYRRMDALKKPDLLHSLLFQQMVKVADEWPGFVSFARWWGFENFRDEDRKPFQPADGGRPIPSLETRAVYAVGKALTRGRIDEEDADWGLTTFDAALQAHPDDVWLNYYKAKSLVVCNRGQEALRFLLPVVMRNLTAGWVWDLLGQIVEVEDGEKAITCYFRAINLAGQPSSVLNTRVRLARLLAQTERFTEAAYQVRQAIHDREKEGWSIKQDLAELLDAAWFQRQDVNSDRREPNVEVAALEILCGMFPDGFEQRTGVLESHNAAKELAYVAFSVSEGLPLPYRFHKGIKKLPAGTVVDLSMMRIEGRLRVVSVRKSVLTELPEFMKPISGIVSISDGKPFGFIMDHGGNRIFVPPDVIALCRLVDSMTVSGSAIRAVDKKTGKEGWKVLTVVER